MDFTNQNKKELKKSKMERAKFSLHFLYSEKKSIKDYQNPPLD